MFELDGRLAADTFALGSTSLNRVLLMNDARFPWLILVPERPDMSEPFDLVPADQAQLWRESMQLSELMKRHFGADKMNVAALGNQVAQLHLHHIARFRTDSAWPAPVWGVGQPEPYETAEAGRHIKSLREALKQTVYFNVPTAL